MNLRIMFQRPDFSDFKNYPKKTVVAAAVTATMTAAVTATMTAAVRYFALARSLQLGLPMRVPQWEEIFLWVQNDHAISAHPATYGRANASRPAPPH